MSLSSPGVIKYLGHVELALKQFSGVYPERVLCELRDAIFSKDELSGIDEMDLNSGYEKLVDTLGNPDAVAASRATDPQPPVTGNAPNWRICCTKCGRSSPADRHGIVRIGARSFHKYVMGRCGNCQKYVSCRLIRDLNQINLTPRLTPHNQPDEMLARLHHPTAAICFIGIILVLIAYWTLW